MQKIVTEITSPVFDLPYRVARDEGLFDQEGVEVEFVPTASKAIRTDPAVTDWNQVSSLRGHGSRFERGEANFYWACEWGNYRRAQDVGLGGRQIGRRAAVAYCALVVPPWSDVYTPQELADKLVAVPFHNGSHYATIQMMEGFLPRENIKLCDTSPKRSVRYHSLMNREIDATPLLEPWITVAEKAGCRVVASCFYHGSEVAAEQVDAETYAAWNRAVTRAVELINADKRKYLRYHFEYDKDFPEVAALSPEEIPLSRLQFIPPTPIPEDEFVRTYDWMVSWNLIQGGQCANDLVDLDLQSKTHEVTAVS
jgi:NitT/TauT family transport system substrate-binding protein